MARSNFNRLILAKTEVTVGTDSTPTGAANSVLCGNLTPVKINANNVNRDLVRPFLGGSEQLFGSASLEISFDCELQGSGTAGTAPAYGPLLLACGFAETVTAVTRVDYVPMSDQSTMKSVTIYYYVDGELHKLLGARGDVTIKMGVGERPMLSFKFVGIDGGKTAAALPTATLTAWKAPTVVSDPNSDNVLLGCTYSAGALSGGTAYPSKGLEFSMGNAVAFTALLGGESVELTQRDVSGKVMFELTAAQAVTLYTSVKANTVTGIGMTHGTVAGSIVILHAPNAQLIDMAQADNNGRVGYEFGIRAIPTSAGNDDLRICLK
jgi:hypothetical protein